MKRFINAAIPKSHKFRQAMLGLIIYSGAVVYIDKYVPHFQGIEAKDITATTSIVIGLIFAFRINSAYDRWWEGRKLWGQLVNDLRNACIKFDMYFDVSSQDKSDFGLLLVGFACALKDHLRGNRTNLKAMGIDFGEVENESPHLPLLTSSKIFQFVQQRRDRASHEAFDYLLLDRHLAALMDICGACERIKSTPISGWFRSSIWMWLTVYLSILPWLLADEFHLWTIIIVVFAGYYGITLELLAEEIQEPFGCDQNDLPTDKFCQTIAESARQVLKCEPDNMAEIEQLGKDSQSRVKW